MRHAFLSAAAAALLMASPARADLTTLGDYTFGAGGASNNTRGLGDIAAAFAGLLVNDPAVVYLGFDLAGAPGPVGGATLGLAAFVDVGPRGGDLDGVSLSVFLLPAGLDPAAVAAPRSGLGGEDVARALESGALVGSAFAPYRGPGSGVPAIVLSADGAAAIEAARLAGVPFMLAVAGGPAGGPFGAAVIEGASLSLTTVPEPSSLGLFALGLAGVGLIRRRRLVQHSARSRLRN